MFLIIDYYMIMKYIMAIKCIRALTRIHINNPRSDLSEDDPVSLLPSAAALMFDGFCEPSQELPSTSALPDNVRLSLPPHQSPGYPHMREAFSLHHPWQALYIQVNTGHSHMPAQRTKAFWLYSVCVAGRSRTGYPSTPTCRDTEERGVTFA